MKNVLLLSAGSAVSQFIIIACTPLLARMYGTADFGQFYFFLSVVSVATCLSTLKYELAIFLPKSVHESFDVMHVALFFIGTFTIGSAFIISLLKLSGWFDHNWLFSSWIVFLIPLNIVIAGSFSVFNLWFNREKKYVTVTTIAIAQSIINVSICLAYPVFFKAGFTGLLLGYLGSLFFR